MTDLRKAAEIALEALETLWDILDDIDTASDMAKENDAWYRKRVEALQKKRWDTTITTDGYKLKGGPVEALRQALAQEEKPPVKTYCGGKPNYCTPVDAVNMSQERVDETAKREHEPWQSVQCTCGGTIYFKHTKREWVGLTDDEIIKCFDSVAFGQVEDDLIINKHVNIFRAIHFIEAKLKEKNT